MGRSGLKSPPGLSAISNEEVSLQYSGCLVDACRLNSEAAEALVGASPKSGYRRRTTLIVSTTDGTAAAPIITFAVAVAVAVAVAIVAAVVASVAAVVDAGDDAAGNAAVASAGSM